MNITQKIVVGIDGSAASMDAVKWAAGEAALRGRELRIVYAIAPWILEPSAEPQIEAMREVLRDGGRDLLEQAAERAAEIAPDLGPETGLVPGGSAEGLLREAEGQELLVVGGHGLGEVSGLLLGSVSLQVVAHASVPTAVVGRLQPGATLEVVVGVDSARTAQPALAFAFEEASRRNARLRAVHAWTHPVPAGPGALQPFGHDEDLAAEDEAGVLSEALAGWREKYPDVEVIEDVVHGGAVRTLTAASARADVLVVGSRGRGGFTGLLLGSVSHALLHRTHCPIVVVPS
ncbi:universal stress protein [Actinocorallia longicatena]|uniref:Universal stress protein n=1 Tax=Actinocorallia longicatena TaxID=111803 RepID=A0ABP6PXL9_9ACTN